MSPARVVPGRTGSTVKQEGRTALASDDVPLLGCHHNDLRLVNLLLGQAHVARQLPNLRRQGLGGTWTVGGSKGRQGRQCSIAACAATWSKRQQTMASRRSRECRLHGDRGKNATLSISLRKAGFTPPHLDAVGLQPLAEVPHHLRHQRLHGGHVDDLEGGCVDGAVLAPGVVKGWGNREAGQKEGC